MKEYLPGLHTLYVYMYGKYPSHEDLAWLYYALFMRK